MRCYCSICRKTQGGGGFAINIMGESDTLKVKGKHNLSLYRARIKDGRKTVRSPGQRHFCKQCGCSLWVRDPRWPSPSSAARVGESGKLTYGQSGCFLARNIRRRTDVSDFGLEVAAQGGLPRGNRREDIGSPQQTAVVAVTDRRMPGCGGQPEGDTPSTSLQLASRSAQSRARSTALRQPASKACACPRSILGSNTRSACHCAESSSAFFQ